LDFSLTKLSRVNWISFKLELESLLIVANYIWILVNTML
jgi:hypothetical protein